ncbi:MAG TPA: PRC-barrel domain-containing protein [Candidatus Thermoplasmatota archaeon]|nr:PRC-barrel domain-containing protein [Candidatus Thermoplasmatota archaeon]
MENASDILIGKTVLNAKGVIIGKVQESIKDSVSGEVTSVLIKPSKEVDIQKYTVTDRGEIIFPFSSLSSVKDIIVIEEPLR